jgi:hypothetical protein
MPRLSPERVEDRDSRNLRLNHISVEECLTTIDLAPNPAHDSSVPVTGPALRKASNENSCPACIRSPWKESNERAASSHRSVRHVEPTLPASSVPRPSPLVTVKIQQPLGTESTRKLSVRVRGLSGEHARKNCMYTLGG